MKFAKLCCGGNDFIVIHGESAPVGERLPDLARRVCTRRFGVGADGLIVLNPHEELPFRMQLFNADGSTAEVSFNGSRCVGLFAFGEGKVPKEFSFASEAGSIHVLVEGDVVTLRVPPPEELRPNMELDERGERVLGHSIRIGVPYFVIFQDDLNYSWIDRIPPRLRTHSSFPRGSNVAVACRREQSLYEARFFERGVAEETMSSGSGCVAVALVAAAVQGAVSPVIMRTKGGDFDVAFKTSGRSISDVTTSGKVSLVFTGELDTEALLEAK